MDQTTLTTLLAAATISGFLIGVQSHRIAQKRYERQKRLDAVNRILEPTVKLRIVHRGKEQ